MRLFPMIIAILLLPVTGCGQDQATTETVSPPVEESSSAQETPQVEVPTTIPTGEIIEEQIVIDEPLGEQESSPVRVAQADPSSRGSQFQKGVHYVELTPAQPTSSSPDKIEVAEVFWYGCPHCYDFEPHLLPWLESKPADVAFVRIPAMWNPQLRTHARAYYTAEVLGVLDKTHSEMFREIHVNRNALDTEAKLVEFFSRYGVDEEEFRSTFNSFAVETRLQRADLLSRRYRIQNVPTMVINGKYVTGGNMARGHDNVLAVIDELVAQESGDR